MNEPPPHRLPDLNDHHPMEEIELEALTTPQLISLLKSPSLNANLDKIEQTLVSRDNNLIETLTVKEVERIEMESRCEALSKKRSEFEEKLAQNLKELDSYRILVEKLKAEVKDLQIALMGEKKMNEELRTRVLQLEREKMRRDQEKGPVIEISDGGEDVNEDDAHAYYVKGLEKDEYFLLTPTPKRRRRISRMVMSDSEDDDVDAHEGNVPISGLKGRKINRNVHESREAIEKKEVDALEGKDVNCGKNSLSGSTPKRKCGFGADDGDDDDDIPINNLRAKRLKIRKQEINESIGNNRDVLEDGDVNIADNFMSSRTPKRKCGLRVIDDDDVDDEVPISNLIVRRHGDNNGKCHDDATSSRRRLVRLGDHSRARAGEKITSTEGSTVQNPSHSKTNGVNQRTRLAVRQKLKFFDTGGPEEEDDSDNEGDSLSGFIVSGSDNSLGCESSSRDGSEGEVGSSSYSSEGSSSDVDLDDVLARLHSDKGNKEWKYEADMLSSLGKDPELCMKAVCALYRQQTSEEQSIKGTIVQNNRGFNQPDAFKGSMVAELLLEGDVDGPVKKSVKELEERFPMGLDYCRKIAFRYSKQLFAIYKQEEDPFFHPSYSSSSSSSSRSG